MTPPGWKGKWDAISQETKMLGAGIAFLMVLLFLAVAAWIFWRGLDGALERDNVMMIASHANGMHQENSSTSRDEIDRVILGLNKASVIGTKVNAAGKPVDHFDTPYRIQHAVVGTETVTTVISAGRDRLFGTADDIRGTASYVTGSQRR